MTLDTLSCSLDVAEPRVKTDRLVGLWNGHTWDAVNSPNVWVDYVSYTGMLLPLPVHPNWQTTGTSGYYRYKTTDYILPSPTKWVDYNGSRFVGDNYLNSQGVNEVVTTAGGFPRNRPMFLSWYAYNSGNSNFIQMECGWVAPGADVSLRFWSNGKVEIYRGSLYLGDGTIVDNVKYPVRYSPTYSLFVQPGKQPAPQYIEVMLIPCRNRELLVLSNQSGGFTFRFDSIDENDTSATITGAGQFWWYVPQGQASVQFAPLNFLTSGSLLSTPYRERFAPAASAAHVETVFYSLPGYGTQSVTGRLRNTADSADFTPNGTAVDVRGRVDLTGDGTSTPYVYGLDSVFSTVTANTDALHSTILDDYTTAGELSIPEEPEGEVLNLTVKTPDALETFGVSSIKALENRPFEAKIGTVLIFAGRTNPPKFKDSISDLAADIQWEIKSRTQAHEKYRFTEVTPYDGLYLADAIKQIAKLPGYSDADMDVPYIDLQLPGVGCASEGEWANIPEIGDTANQWLQKFWETYARNYWRGWVPTASGMKYRFKSEAAIGSTPILTLYDTASNANVHGGLPLTDWSGWYNDFDEQPLEVEANFIRVLGRDPRTNLPIISDFHDSASIDPTTIPSLRPENWLGEPRVYAWVDPAITTQAAAAYCNAILQTRLPVKWYAATWTSQMLFKGDGAPVWKGDVVKLYNKGDYRISTIRVPFSLESNTFVWRKATYTGRKIPGSSPT